jgi:hypothetical protein
MKIRLFTSAFNDLAGGRNFYERQGDGLGEFFLNSFFRTSIHWFFTVEFIGRFSVSTACCRNDSLTPFTTSSRAQIVWSFIECWTAANVHAALARH